MMGRQTAPATPFYGFDLEAHVPGDHLLRQVDRFLDMDRMRTQLAPFCSHLGRPSIDPEPIVRMLLIGYLTGIRSERRLCDEVHLNLAHRWFCRLGLDGRVPDHSTDPKVPARQVPRQRPAAAGLRGRGGALPRGGSGRRRRVRRRREPDPLPGRALRQQGPERDGGRGQAELECPGHGRAYRREHAGHLNLPQLKVMSAIETCRTAALGGHVSACTKCGRQHVAYNSCRNRHCPSR